MGALEKVKALKRQGLPDQEITNQLQQQGVSPGEIADALSQAKIRNAIVESGEAEESIPQAEPSYDQVGGENPYTPANQTPAAGYAPEASYAPEAAYAPQTPGAPQEEYYSQQGEYEGYAPSMNTDTDTMIEIAGQVFSEKMQKIQKQIEDMTEFRTIAQTNLLNLSERLKRMETMIDKLQISILDKVGSYGKSLATTKKEIAMVQDSFKKVINPVVNRNSQIIRKAPTKKVIAKKKVAKKSISKK